MPSFLMRYSVLYELNTLDACWIAVDVWSNSSMQNRFGLVVVDVMPIYMIMPRYSHNFALSINYSKVIFSPTVILMLS